MSVSTAGDFQEMIAKLGLHRPVYYTDLTTEYNLIKLLDHLTGTELTQISTRLS